MTIVAANAMTAEYADSPRNNVLTCDPAKTPATLVDVMTSNAVGPQINQCFEPNDTD